MLFICIIMSWDKVNKNTYIYTKLTLIISTQNYFPSWSMAERISFEFTLVRFTLMKDIPHKFVSFSIIHRLVHTFFK